MAGFLIFSALIVILVVVDAAANRWGVDSRLGMTDTHGNSDRPGIS